MKDTLSSKQAPIPSSQDFGQGTFAIVVSSYHEAITRKLLEGSLETFSKANVARENVRTLWVPGAWEIPLGATLALEDPRTLGVVTLGCVIRGETTHDQHINQSVAAALMQLSIDHKKPVAFGVLTVNSLEQAEARSGGAVGNKGEEAAQAVLAMLQLKHRLSR